MSFRKRNEPLAGPRHPPSFAVPPGRAPVQRPTAKPAAEKPRLGVRPSPVTSQPTVTTGCADLDKILGHQGLPLGTGLLVEEYGTTDFLAVLLRAFAAQGVVHCRAEKAAHVVVVGAPSLWVKDLPGEYKGLAKDQQRARIAREQAEVSVLNVMDKDMKIAWRYGLNRSNLPLPPVSDDNFVTQFDITQRLVPPAGPPEVSFVPVAANPAETVAQVRRLARTHAAQNKTVRIVVPGLLAPGLYPPQCSQPTYVLPLMHGLRSVLSEVPLAVLLASIALDLYPRESVVTHMLETLADGVVALQPFNAAMAALVERAYKNEPAKIQHGLVNVVKVPVLSERGMMMVANGEWAFRNGRKKFEIEEWGIPVEEADEEPKQIDF